MTDPNAAGRQTWNTAAGIDWAHHDADIAAFFSNITAELIAISGIGPGDRVIDLGCGTAQALASVVPLVGRNGAFLGLDISQPLMAEAHKRVVALPLGGPDIQILDHDVQTGAPDTAPFDRLISRCGIQFFSDPVVAFSNLTQMMRPGATWAFCAWGRPSANPWFTEMARATQQVLGLASDNSDDGDTRPSPVALQSLDYTIDLLARAGLRAPTGTRRMVDICHPGGLAAVYESVRYIGPSSNMVEKIPPTPAQQAAIRAETDRRFARYVTPDGGVCIPCELNFYTAIV